MPLFAPRRRLVVSLDGFILSTKLSLIRTHHLRVGFVVDDAVVVVGDIYRRMSKTASRRSRRR